MATLQIGNRKEFDQQVWQTETDFNNAKYTEWLRNAAETLQRIKNVIEGDAYPTDITPTDANILGDVINMLESIEVDSDYRADSWTCTAGDFGNYDTSHIDEEEMETMINEVAKGMQNDGNVSDTYWDIIEYIAEQHGCKEQPDPFGPDDDED